MKVLIFLKQLFCSHIGEADTRYEVKNNHIVSATQTCKRCGRVKTYRFKY